MGINSYGAPSSTPIERLAALMGVVKEGKGLVDEFKDSAKRSRENDPTSDESKQARGVYQQITGSPIADSISAAQIKTYAGPLFEGVSQDRKFAQEKELLGLKSAAEQKSKIAASAKDKMLPPDKVLAVNEGNAIPGLLEDIRGTIESNQGDFGPIQGRLSALNPYNEKSSTIDAQMRSASQAFGRYMEGGVLRKEDEDKYRKMFPQLGDTPEVAKNKLAIVERLLAKRQNSNVAALKQSGYDVSGVDQGLSIPEAPAILSNKGKKGLIPEAVAGNQWGIKPGTVENGFMYGGGNPADQKSWVKVKK
jgi:hypothetical protein